MMATAAAAFLTLAGLPLLLFFPENLVQQHELLFQQRELFAGIKDVHERLYTGFVPRLIPVFYLISIVLS